MADFSVEAGRSLHLGVQLEMEEARGRRRCTTEAERKRGVRKRWIKGRWTERDRER